MMFTVDYSKKIFGAYLQGVYVYKDSTRNRLVFVYQSSKIVVDYATSSRKILNKTFLIDVTKYTLVVEFCIFLDRLLIEFSSFDTRTLIGYIVHR